MEGRGREKVLIVKDDAAQRVALLRGLQHLICSPLVAASTVHEAAQIAKDNPLCAALIDVFLPDGRGIELIPILRTGHHSIRIVMLSAYPSIAMAVSCVRLGADDFLAKPASPGQICSALSPSRSASLGRGTSAQSELATTLSLHRATWEHIQRVMSESDGNISEAARRLRIHRQSLQRMLKKRPDVFG